MNQKYKWWIIGGASILLLATLTTAFIIRKKRKENLINSKPKKNIIIGDSVTPIIAKRLKKAIILGSEQGEKNLWKSGENVKWLKNAVSKYPVSKDVSNVIVNIGTNGAFNIKDDIDGLFEVLTEKFPKAKFLVIQGSWGWGDNKNVTLEKVNKYYDKFQEKGAKIIEPPIGKTNNPHTGLPVYDLIAKAIDDKI